MSPRVMPAVCVIEDLDCPGCECCTEADCGESAQCIAQDCRCFTDQPDRPSEDVVYEMGDVESGEVTPNDARLWALMLGQLRDAGIDGETAGVLARKLVATVRRERDPDRRTFGPGDDFPEVAPERVADVDGAVWEHQAAGRGVYRMSVADRVRYNDSTEDVEGCRPWQYLLDSEGPLTEVAS